jgi:hypothetical protein
MELAWVFERFAATALLFKASLRNNTSFHHAFVLFRRLQILTDQA